MKDDAKENTQHRTIRLLNLMCEIKSNPWQRPEHLCRLLGICRAQFFEDKKALARIGFVFDYDRKQRRYVIKRDKSFPVPDFTAIEVLSLVMAVSQISTSGDPSLSSDAIKAIKKIIASSERHVRELLEWAIDDNVLRDKFKVDSRIIEELWQAQERGARLEILYNDFSQQRERTIQIDPYAIYFRGRALYLDAFVVDEQKVLMFRVSRIRQILRRTGVFQMRPDYNFRERHRHSFRVFTSDKPPQLVRIKFGPNAARYVDEIYHHGSEKKLFFTDGSMILKLTVSDPREVLWYLVFPWGDEAEILEPQWLREEAIRVVQKIMAKYQTSNREKR